MENNIKADLDVAKKNKSMSAEKVDTLILKPEYYGPFWKYVSDKNITDTDFNGSDLWLTDIDGRRTKIENHGVTPEFINAFCQRVANQVSKPFNKMNNLLEAETPTLRISILHDSATETGISVCLRHTSSKVRMTAKSIIRDKYCHRTIMNLLANCVLAKMNFVVGGEPAAGKTEAAKFWSQVIPNEQRVITIEDSPEWHYKAINPGHDCIEMRINDEFPYAKAIKTCLRQNPKWIMLSEARSVEAKYLIEAWSTGVNGMTTIHLDDIRNAPSRLHNMMATREDADRLENDIYEFAHVIFLIRKKQFPDGTSRRYMDQMGFLYRENNVNKIQMIVNDGEVVSYDLPKSVAARFKRADIANPFENKLIDKAIGNIFTFEIPKKIEDLPKIEPVVEPIDIVPVQPIVKEKPRLIKDL